MWDDNEYDYFYDDEDDGEWLDRPDNVPENNSDEDMSSEVEKLYQEIGDPLQTIIGSDNPLDKFAAVGAFVEEVCVAKKQEDNPFSNEKSPISGKDYVQTKDDTFKKRRQKQNPFSFETYVEACVEGKEQLFIQSVKETIDVLYYDIFGYRINDVYNYCVGKGFISKVPTQYSIKHLKNLKTIADYAIETNTFDISKVIDMYRKQLSFNLEEGLVQ